MSVAVRYYTQSGNSKKLADRIAAECGVEAKDVTCELTEKVDILFLVTALYAGGINDSVVKFVETNSAKIGKIVNISSAASNASTYKNVKRVADRCGIAMEEEQFKCNGEFLFMHKGRPNDKDLDNVAEFTKKIMA